MSITEARLDERDTRRRLLARTTRPGLLGGLRALNLVLEWGENENAFSAGENVLRPFSAENGGEMVSHRTILLLELRMVAENAREMVSRPILS